MRHKERVDIEQARSKMSPSIGYWRDISAVGKALGVTEVVQHMAGGQYDAHSGVLVLTDERLFFIAERHVRWSVPRADMWEVGCGYGELFGTVSIRSSGSDFQVRFVARRDATALVTAVGGRCRCLPKGVAIVR